MRSSSSSLLSANSYILSSKIHQLNSSQANNRNSIEFGISSLGFPLSTKYPFSYSRFRFDRFCSTASVNPTKCDTNLNTTTKETMSTTTTTTTTTSMDYGDEKGLNVEIGTPNVPVYMRWSNMSLADQAFFLLAFIACTTSIAFTSVVIAAVPTLYAMGRAATSLSKLADTAREELPSTMAAIRLSGMEISDLTLELSDLSQEIADGVSKSAQAVQAAEAGIRQIGALAKQQTVAMIQERASLPIISLQPVVAGAARKTSRAVGHAKKTLMNIISRGEFCAENEDVSDRAEL